MKKTKPNLNERIFTLILTVWSLLAACHCISTATNNSLWGWFVINLVGTIYGLCEIFNYNNKP